MTGAQYSMQVIFDCPVHQLYSSILINAIVAIQYYFCDAKQILWQQNLDCLVSYPDILKKGIDRGTEIDGKFDDHGPSLERLVQFVRVNPHGHIL